MKKIKALKGTMKRHKEVLKEKHEEDLHTEMPISPLEDR